MDTMITLMSSAISNCHMYQTGAGYVGRYGGTLAAACSFSWCLPFLLM
jgi:hypothetical protein